MGTLITVLLTSLGQVGLDPTQLLRCKVNEKGN